MMFCTCKPRKRLQQDTMDVPKVSLLGILQTEAAQTFDHAMKNRKTKRPGKVQKIIKPLMPEQSEKAEIVVEGADHLYREIRIENRLEDEQGNEVKLKEGADVDVVVEADADATVPTHPPRQRPKRG